MNKLTALFDSDNSYIRVRSLVLIACNAKWDTAGKIDRIIDSYVAHITDRKPIAARQCIKLLPEIAPHKPELKETIVSALRKADTGVFTDSMRPLICKDIQNALAAIQTPHAHT